MISAGWRQKHGTNTVRVLAVVISFIAAGAYVLPSPAFGQAPLSSSYITPFPKSDRYKVLVIGDWMAAGLSSSLQDIFKQDSTLQITNITQSNFGLARPEQNDFGTEIERLASGGDANIAILMVGVNDRTSIRTASGARLQPGSEEWKTAYSKEAEKIIKKLRAANIAVYWVGLPPMAQPNFNEIVVSMNEAVREACYINGVKFLETSAPFTDQSGAYNAFGADLTGQTKRLRDGDGIGLTPAGYRKLANYVEITLRRDLALARSQKNVPLAGDEDEQARVVPTSEQGRSNTQGGASTSSAADAQRDQIARPSTIGPDASQQRRANPSTYDAVRQDAAAFSSSSPQGELVVSDLGDGLTAIAVISPNNAFSVRDLQRQTPLTDRLYFRVLSKGEALPPKEGRADDFAWRGDAASKSGETRSQ